MAEPLPSVLYCAAPSGSGAGAGAASTTSRARERAVQAAASVVTGTELTQFKGARGLATLHGYCTSIVCGHRCDQAIPHGVGGGLGICNFCLVASESASSATSSGKQPVLTIDPAEVEGDSSMCITTGELNCAAYI